ncbi:MAG: hypothetical protein M3P30_12475 [Chloroflexota bacterium]|nr:hypothetical protein [Chloroflexota bacterium]
MPPKRRPPSADLARLTVLAAGDEAAFLSHALELLASHDRLAREAALSALIDRPLADARPALRSLYNELDGDGSKRDQGATMREMIVRTLRALADVRDADVAVRASGTNELILGQDTTWRLRVHGLRMLAEIAPDVFPYYAVEHLDDADDLGGSGEPANSALQLLADMGHYVPIYQWLIAGERHPTLVTVAFELLADAPREIVQRYAANALDVAIRRNDEPLCTTLAEAIVQREMEACYGRLGRLISSKISDELYNYLAVLLAATNRAPLLAILEQELHRGRHARLVEVALRIRTTPEQAAILTRWEDGDP